MIFYHTYTLAASVKSREHILLGGRICAQPVSFSRAKQLYKYKRAGGQGRCPGRLPPRSNHSRDTREMCPPPPGVRLALFTHQPLMGVDRLVLRAEIWSAVRPMPVR